VNLREEGTGNKEKIIATHQGLEGNGFGSGLRRKTIRRRETRLKLRQRVQREKLYVARGPGDRDPYAMGGWLENKTVEVAEGGKDSNGREVEVRRLKQ